MGEFSNESRVNLSVDEFCKLRKEVEWAENARVNMLHTFRQLCELIGVDVNFSVWNKNEAADLFAKAEAIVADAQLWRTVATPYFGDKSVDALRRMEDDAKLGELVRDMPNPILYKTHRGWATKLHPEDEHYPTPEAAIRAAIKFHEEVVA